jgi:imidazole glycerol phosphate synthase subunit HisF
VKKIVGSILVRDQIVVHSTNFCCYKPIGSLEKIVLRLQELEVDEIAVLNLTHSGNPLNDFRQLFSDSLLSNINTPLAYGGGIDTRACAEAVIAAGCERIILSGRNWTPAKSRKISVNLGDQSVLIHLPIVRNRLGISLLDNKSSLGKYFESTPNDWGGELYLKNRDMDGRVGNNFDFFREISLLSRDLRTPILAGGGISNFKEVGDLLGLPSIRGVVIGSWLNREELVIPKLKGLLGQSAGLRSLVRFVK